MIQIFKIECNQKTNFKFLKIEFEKCVAQVTASKTLFIILYVNCLQIRLCDGRFCVSLQPNGR